MSALERKRTWDPALTKKATTTTAISKSVVVPSYFFSGEKSKLRPCCGMTSSGPVGRQTMLEKRYFEPAVKELYNFERHSFDKFKFLTHFKQTRSPMQGVSFSFKMPNARCMMKSESVLCSVKRNYSDTDLKQPIRTIVRSKSSSELLEEAVLETTKTTLVSKLTSGGNSMQGLSSEKNLNTPECSLKSDLHSSCSSSSKKRKVEDKADGGPLIKMKKKVDSKKKVAVLGNTISSTSFLTASGGSVGNRNNCFPGAICSSRLSAALNRNSDERSNAKEASQTSLAPYMTSKEAPPKFNQCFFDFFSDNLNKKKVEQSELSCRNNESKTPVEKSMPSKKDLIHGIGLQDTMKIPFSSSAETQPLTTIIRNNGKVISSKSDVKGLSLIRDTKDAAEIEVTKEVESLVEKALLHTTASSYFRTSQDLRKSVSGSVQEGRDLDITNDDAKLRKMWSLVAEESSLTNSLNDINAKISKIKADLCSLSNESFQVTKRLDEVRFLKNQLLNNSHCKMFRQ